jgi:uncharacterized small protein (DUF1192 family)
MDNNYTYIFAALNEALSRAEADKEYYSERVAEQNKRIAWLESELARMDLMIKNATNPGEDNNGEV